MSDSDDEGMCFLCKKCDQQFDTLEKIRSHRLLAHPRKENKSQSEGAKKNRNNNSKSNQSKETKNKAANKGSSKATTAKEKSFDNVRGNEGSELSSTVRGNKVSEISPTVRANKGSKLSPTVRANKGSELSPTVRVNKGSELSPTVRVGKGSELPLTESSESGSGSNQSGVKEKNKPTPEDENLPVLAIRSRKKRCAKCDECHMDFFSMSEMLIHIKKHSHTTMGFYCQYCERRYKSHKNLRRHSILEHRKAETEKQLPRRTYICEDCNTTFEHQSQLTKHYTDEHGDAEQTIYECGLCQNAFKTYGNLEYHMDLHTNGEVISLIESHSVTDHEMDMEEG